MITDYFDIEEVVCLHVYNGYKDRPSLNGYGHFAWNFFDVRLLVTMETIRIAIGKPIYINDYSVHGTFSQRGFRCILCDLMQVVYKLGKLFTDPHALGKALDFDVKGMTAQEVRDWLVTNQTILPYPIRLENNVEWVHLDVLNNGVNKIEFFTTIAA
jgi:hypothetical protein